MTQEEKQLLLKDICARLPYDMWAEYEGKEWLVTGYGHGRVSLLSSLFSSVVGPCPLVEEVRPYLRPMSSMTEEEQRYIWDKYEPSPLFADFEDVGDVSELFKYCHMNIGDANLFVDWLIAHHFDYRGLIPMGLALEAPNNMYKN